MKQNPDDAVVVKGVVYETCLRCCHAYAVSEMRLTANPLDPYNDDARVLICVECIRERNKMAQTPDQVSRSRGRAYSFVAILAACAVSALFIYFAYRGGQP